MKDDLTRLSELLVEASDVIERIGTETHAMANAQDRLLEAAMWVITAIQDEDGE